MFSSRTTLTLSWRTSSEEDMKNDLELEVEMDRDRRFSIVSKVKWIKNEMKKVEEMEGMISRKIRNWLKVKYRVSEVQCQDLNKISVNVIL